MALRTGQSGSDRDGSPGAGEQGMGGEEYWDLDGQVIQAACRRSPSVCSGRRKLAN